MIKKLVDKFPKIVGTVTGFDSRLQQITVRIEGEGGESFTFVFKSANDFREAGCATAIGLIRKKIRIPENGNGQIEIVKS